MPPALTRRPEREQLSADCPSATLSSCSRHATVLQHCNRCRRLVVGYHLGAALLLARGLEELRYGFVCEIEGHPPSATQRRLVERAGCDLIIEETRPSFASLKARRKLLFDLRAGDEVLIPSLDTLQMSTGELVLLFQKFDQNGISLRIVAEEADTVLSFSGDARSLLALLASNDILRPDRQRPRRRARRANKPMTRYQIDYAIELRRRGASIRAIGRLFQIPPSDLQALLNDKPRERPDIPADIPLRDPLALRR
jgi:DNA invertase Pin-like site-specific DNA recombinase